MAVVLLSIRTLGSALTSWLPEWTWHLKGVWRRHGYEHGYEVVSTHSAFIVVRTVLYAQYRHEETGEKRLRERGRLSRTDYWFDEREHWLDRVEDAYQRHVGDGQ